MRPKPFFEVEFGYESHNDWIDGPDVCVCGELSLAPAASQKKNPDRNADFGDERIPTSWSLVLGNKTIGLADALHYAQGQAIVPSL